jgi:hypothetical protein
MSVLYAERDEGERVADFEEKIKKNAKRILWPIERQDIS